MAGQIANRVSVSGYIRLCPDFKWMHLTVQLLIVVKMRLSTAISVLFASSALGGVVKRQTPFSDGQPVDGKGKGAPILGIIESVQNVVFANIDFKQVEPITKWISRTLPTWASKALIQALSQTSNGASPTRKLESILAAGFESKSTTTCRKATTSQRHSST